MRYKAKGYESKFLQAIIKDDAVALRYVDEKSAKQGRLRLRVIATELGFKYEIKLSQKEQYVYGWMPLMFHSHRLTGGIEARAMENGERRAPREGLDPRLLRLRMELEDAD